MKETLELLKDLFYFSISGAYGIGGKVELSEFADLSYGALWYEEYNYYQSELHKESNTFLGFEISILNEAFVVGAARTSSVEDDFENEHSGLINNPDRDYDNNIYIKVFDDVYNIVGSVEADEFVEDTDKITLAGGGGAFILGGGFDAGFSDSVMKEICYYSEPSLMPVLDKSPVQTPTPTSPAPFQINGGGTTVRSYIK